MPKATTTKPSTTAKAAKKAAPKRKANAYQMPENIPVGEILTDLCKQQWKCGPSIGTGGFGEIYCATKSNESIKKYEDYPYVVKVEPHGNGPLFVEMHFYMRNGKLADIETFRKKHGLKTLGMPHMVGHGSHDLNKKKHRFIVMPRYSTDIWSIFLKNDRKMPLHTVYQLAIQMLYVYEYIHECTYVHADLKGTNMLLGFGKNGGSQVYLVDFGLASHYTTKDFKPDPKKMHNGTIEYTSRDAHQGVPTMRGDFEILGYNLIQWAGGDLLWEKKNLLGTPVKVQQAKDDFMSNLESGLKESFANQPIPGPIFSYLKYVTKLKYDEKPDYGKCRKEFLNGLKSLGKTNSGDLEFNMNKSITSKKVIKSPKAVTKERTKLRPVITPKATEDDAENISPKPKTSRKRNTSNDPHTASPSKKVRGSSSHKISASSSSIVNPKLTQLTSTGQHKSSTESSTIVNNHVNNEKAKKNKTYNLNFELDISFDANVVVNIKRKSKKAPKQEPKSKNESIQSTDEISATERSFIVTETKITKKATRTSPRK